MVSAQEYYEMFQARRKLILCNQMESCEYILYSKLEHFDSDVQTGHFKVELEDQPLPELIAELTRLGYTNIKFSTEEKRYLDGMVGVLSFDVPQLIEKQVSASNKDTL